jgi:hypothetical protein|tara:strand:- start:3559 stop:3660 length:102 start_codon:yes stop_codon:yes gene_type:complete
MASIKTPSKVWVGLKNYEIINLAHTPSKLKYEK